jgi:hypothetical protein
MMEMFAQAMQLMRQMATTSDASGSVTASVKLVDALIRKSEKQEEREKERYEPWNADDKARLEMIRSLMTAAKARGIVKVKEEFLTNLLIGQRYDPQTAMVGLYRLFEPDQLEWWDTVCQLYPDNADRVRAHNLRLAEKAKSQPSLCPIIQSIDPAISRLTIPMLPFEAEGVIAQAQSYNQDLTQACVVVASEVRRDHQLRTRSVVEGAGPDRGRGATNVKLPKAPWREPTPAELVAGEPHLWIVNHPDGNVSVDAAPLAQWLVNFEANVAHELRTNQDEVRQALTRIIKAQEARRQPAPQQQQQQQQQQQRQYAAAPAAPRGNAAQSNYGRGRGRGGGYGRGAAYTKGGEQADEPVKEVAANPGGFP